MIKFEILTPLGFTVRTSEIYWQKLITKHPDLNNFLQEIKQTLNFPVEIRCSSRDQGVLLFYLPRKDKNKRWFVTVVRKLNGDGFVITAYQTDAIKEGTQIWHK